MTPEFTLKRVVIWDSCRVQQLNLPQHNRSRSGILDQINMKIESGWINESPSFAVLAGPFCQSTKHRMMPSHQFIKLWSIFLLTSQCFSHVWWWYGTPIKRKHATFHPTIKLGSSAFTKTCNTRRFEQGVPKGTCESETKIWSFGYLDHLYHGPDWCEFVRHGFCQCGF